MRLIILFLIIVLSGCVTTDTTNRLYRGMTESALESMLYWSTTGGDDPFLNKEDWVYFKEGVKIVGSNEGPVFYVFKNNYLSSWHGTKRAAYDAVNRLINPEPIQRERRELKGDSSKQENRSQKQETRARRKARQAIQID